MTRVVRVAVGALIPWLFMTAGVATDGIGPDRPSGRVGAGAGSVAMDAAPAPAFEPPPGSGSDAGNAGNAI